jgi:hypothetical protein
MSVAGLQFARDSRVILRPPRLHWTAVLVLSITSHFLFWMIWLIVQANWVKKATGRGRALKWSVLNLCGLPLSLLVMSLPQMIVGYLGMPRQYEGAAAFFRTLSVLPVTGILVAAVISIATAFVMRAELQSTAVDLRLSGPMTFFFGPIYFQYFLDDLCVIDPQPPVGPTGQLPPTWRGPRA